MEAIRFSNDGTLAASVRSTDRPYEIFASPNGKLNRLTHVNDAWVAQLQVVARGIRFLQVEGRHNRPWLPVQPIDYVAGKKYPTILRPHGGPVWAYYSEYQDIAQLLASNGYVVLLPNPRGSSGYGEDFCKAIFADWGNKDFEDDMAFVDYAIEQGIADPDKLGVGGWSYGGISTDFIIGKTEPFQGAISGRGLGGIHKHVGPRSVRQGLHHRTWISLGTPRSMGERVAPSIT